MSTPETKKPRQGSVYGKVIDRIAYPANVYHWPIALKSAGLWCGNIIGSRVEKGSNDERRVVVTLECHGGVIYDGWPLTESLLAEQSANYIHGPDAFLVAPNEFYKTNLRRVVQDRRPETRPGTTRLAIVERDSLREFAPLADLPVTAVNNNQKPRRCPRPSCNGEISDVTANPALKSCTYCRTFFGPGSGAKNEALPLWSEA